MPPNSSLGALVGELIALPFVVLRDLGRLVRWLFALRRRYRSIPLPERNQLRAAGGGFVVAVCIGLALSGLPMIHQPPGSWAVMASAAIGLLYLVGGLLGSRGSSRIDFFSVMWWSLTLAACIAGLLALEGVI
jgi:hypothetical protein